MKPLRKIARPLILGSGCVLAAWMALPKPPLCDGLSFSRCIRDRNGSVLRVTLSGDQKYRIWTPLSQISPDLIEATLRYEDKYYARHPGVNPIALARCGFEFVWSRRARAGGSTITMQLARLRFHLHTRSLPGKFSQIVRALELERHYSKSQILEAYLNLAPYGRNVEGIGAASELYFGKPAARLSAPEAVALSVIPQSPARRALFAGRGNRSVQAAQNNWYKRARCETGGGFSAREFDARAQVVKKLVAPHFVLQVLESSGGGNQITTTLDWDKQQLIERWILDYVATNRHRGINNAAALLVDCRTMDVLAQVGSADFNKIDINGQVDGTRSRRSPGSTLKPFVYALALDQGLIQPLSILADAPRSFGEYNPENFDRDFLGPIRACDALARSRNLPAVELASRLSHPTLYEFLRNAGVALPKPESHYGLALPLGGAEVSMQDLLRLYATLANHGELRPLHYATDAPVATGRQILSPEAAFLTLEMLGNIPRPEMNCADGNHSAPVYWKTGTSHGFRDAWSIAVFDNYALGLWVGNFDGKPNPAFVGRTAAAPLLFQIIDSLRATWPEPSRPHLPPAGANLKRVELCAVSGDLPNAFCTERVQGWFIPGVSPIKSCEVHHEVLVDVASGLRVSIDDGTRALRREVYESWPSDLLVLFERAGLPRKLPPPFLPDSNRDVATRLGRAPQIVSPNGKEILTGATNPVPLQAKAEGDVREIYWFAGRKFIGKAAPNQALNWKATAGDYEIVALDDHGRSSSRDVAVR
jgi:penicillin-binding protein 1C